MAVEILHIKIADQLHWGRMNEVVRLVNDARKNGVDVQANVYPYTRGNNNLATILPPWAHEGGTGQMLARLKDAGRPFSKQAAVAKLICTDAAMRVTTDAVQVLGGAGYTRDFPAERYMREAKVTQIFEGTNQIQRLVIARQLLRG